MNSKIKNIFFVFSGFVFLFCNTILYSEEVFTQVPIWGGQIDGAVLCYSSPSVIYAWNSLNLWVSEDAGETWQKTKLADFTGSGPSYVAVHPSSPNIVLAWVEAFEKYETQRGLYRSEDYGETWQKIQDIIHFRPARQDDVPEITKIESLYFSLKNFDTVYIFGNSYWDPKTGQTDIILYKSTDTGVTWQKKILFANDKNYNNTVSFCVTCDENSDILFIGVTYKEPYQQEYKLFKSTDGGETWKDITFKSGDFVVPPVSIKASTTGCVAIFGGWLSASEKLYISTDTGNSFSEFSIGYYSYVNKYKFNEMIPAFTFSPDGKNLYLSAKGYELNIGSEVPRIIVSSFTLGSGWSEPIAISSGLLAGKAGLEARSILIDPINPNNMYIADCFDYAFFKSTDAGHIWEAKNYGLAGAYVNSGVKDSLGNLYIVTKSAVYKSTDSGNTWSKLYSGFTPLEKFKIAVHPENNNLIFLLGYGNIFISEDGGVNWKDGGGNQIDQIFLPWYTYLPATTDAVFDLRNSSIVYYGKHIFGETGRIKQKNIIVYNFVTKEIKELNFDSGSVFGLAVDPNDPSILYAGVGDLTTEGGGGAYLNLIPDGLWKIKVDENGNVVSHEKVGLSDVIPFKIIFDTTTPNVIYAAAYDQPLRVGPNFKYIKAYGGLYKSEDNGLSWKKIGVIGNVENPIGIDAVIDFQVVNGIVYVANKDKTGFTNLYYSVNGGVTFESYQANIGEIKCLILGSLYAGSSNGLWRLNRQPQPLTYEVENPRVYAFPNPFNPKNGYTVLKYFVPQGKTVNDLRVSIYNIAGELIYEFKEPTGLEGGYAYYYAWDGRNQNGNLCSKGVYIAVFRSNLGITKTKVVLVK